MVFTPSEDVPVGLDELQVSPDDAQGAPRRPRAQPAFYPRTPTRLTKYDPHANSNSPNTPIRPFSAPTWPVYPLGSPIEPSRLVDLEFDSFDWDALESIVRKFDENELLNFNSVFYRQVLHQLSLESRPKWLELLLHLGVQNETLWIDRLHNFQEDYLIKEAKRAGKRRNALLIQKIETVSKAVWFQRWYNAGVLKVQLDQFLKAPTAQIFNLWREEAYLLKKKLAQVDAVYQVSQKTRLFIRWRNHLKQIRDLDEKSVHFDHYRLIQIGVHGLKNSLSKRFEATKEFQAEHAKSVFARWRRRLHEEQCKKYLEPKQKSIYLKSWLGKLESFRFQLEKADRYQKSQVIHWYQLWTAKLEQMYDLYASGEFLFESNLKATVFRQWRQNAKLLSRGAPFLFYSQQRVKHSILHQWRLLAGIYRESERFRQFFAAQEALKCWRLKARCLVLESRNNITHCQQTFDHWQRKARLKTLERDKQIQDLRQLFGLWREETQNTQRREHALSLRARLLRKKFEFAEFWRTVQRKYTEQQYELLAAENYYNERLQTKVFDQLSKFAVSRIEGDVMAGDLALQKLKKTYFSVWRQAFKQVRDEQFEQLESYAKATHAMKLMKSVFSQWRGKTYRISEAEEYGDLILCERYFRLWLGKLANLQEQLARAGDWYIESSRVITLGKWRDRLDQVRQNELELELLQDGRAIEKAAAIFEQWRAATMLVKDKDPLLARRSDWFAQQQTRRIFRKWRRSTERSHPSPQTPLRSEALLQRSTVSRMLSQRRPIGRVHSTGSPISRRGADSLI
ncbi:hypothetical protein B9G98_01164 [Wickerhamiella sorbophila]|uniref:Sfi1 spindle body domain-containing protein n=1 Tax=Wickerhamiella sorbophila TaxID=45607 RepID=A0A2T0FEZ5_9ASCO|nr:hypothetical protein B9G98_01164 [Wickerhamiella sorbophila]PRT53544.1 hypothetical protein B9G98_01164 [Wickerhamiella sorbophila]